MEPPRPGWDCGISSHLALNKSCDHTGALHYLPLENAFLDLISSYLEYRSPSKAISIPLSLPAVGITKWDKVLLQGHLHCFPQVLFSCVGRNEVK